MTGLTASNDSFYMHAACSYTPQSSHTAVQVIVLE